MADVITTVYGFTLPEVGASDDTWGTKLNADLQKLETLFVNAFTSGGPATLGVLKSANIPSDLDHNFAIKMDGAKDFRLKTSAGVQEGSYGIDVSSNVYVQRLNSVGTTLARIRLEADGAINAHVGFFKGSAAGLTGVPATAIPNLDASKITSGVFSTARIPDLPASRITSGIFSIARIPDVPFTQVTGIVPIAQGGTDANDAAEARANIGANNATNLTSGILPTARLPSDSVAATWVANRYSDLASGAIGAYRWLLGTGGGDSSGASVAGSSLNTPYLQVNISSTNMDMSYGSGPSGTWRCMQGTTGASDEIVAGMWLRIV